MGLKIKRFSSINSDEKSIPVIEPPTLDLRKLERKLLESGYSDRQIDIILDELRRIDMAQEDKEELVEWIRSGKILDPKVLGRMKSKGLDFPAAWIEVKGSSVRHFSFFDKLRNLGERYEDWKNPRRVEDRKRKEKEKEQKRLQNRSYWELNPTEKLAYLKKNCPDRVSPLHKKLLSIKGPNVSWGDGDEYPDFFVRENGVLSLGHQSEPEYTWEGNCWRKDDYSGKGPQKVYNLKADLLKWFKEEIKAWEGIDYLDDDETEEVIRELKRLCRDIQQKL